MWLLGSTHHQLTSRACFQYTPCRFHRTQQFHLFKAAPLGVSLPFLLVGPLTPDMRAQNDLRRLEALLPRLSLLGFLVTGRLRLAPVLRFAAARPLAFKPPVLACLLGLYPWNGLDFFLAFMTAMEISRGEQQSQNDTSDQSVFPMISSSVNHSTASAMWRDSMGGYIKVSTCTRTRGNAKPHRAKCHRLWSTIAE